MLVHANERKLAWQASRVEVHGRKDKHEDVPGSSLSDQPPINEKEVKLKSADMPSTSMGEQCKSRIVKLRMLMMTQLDSWLLYRIELVEVQMIQVYLGMKIMIFMMATRMMLMMD
ncbi:hypothetical protein Tco_1052623 [Tanacetum coccineum]